MFRVAEGRLIMGLFKTDTTQQRQLFEQELMPYMDAMYGLAYHYTRDPDRAADLVQDTFLKAYREFKRFSAGTNGRAWLARILTNTFLNSVKRRNLETKHFAETNDFNDIEQRFSGKDEEDPELAVMETSATFSDEVKRALDQLPEEMRVVVLLADVFDYSYADISTVIGRPLGTVMSRLHRARKQLRDQLTEFAQQQGVIRDRDGDDKQPTADILPMKKKSNGGGRNGL